MTPPHDDRVIELVVFSLVDGATPERFLGTVDAVSEWIRTQPGFISRDLSYSAEQDRWIEIIHWGSLRNAHDAAKAAESSDSCLPMFAMIDMETMLFLHGTPAIAPVAA